MQKVGETEQPLHNRMNGHCFDIIHRQTDVSPVAAHFTSEGLRAILRPSCESLLLMYAGGRTPFLEKSKRAGGLGR